MFLKNRYVLIIAASVLGFLPASGLALQFGTGFQAPGVPGNLQNRMVTIKGCGHSSSTTSPQAGPMFLCNTDTEKVNTYNFTLSYENTETKTKVISDGTFTVTIGPINDKAECKGTTSGVTFFNNKQGVCSAYYQIYGTVTSAKPAPWGQSLWAPHNRGFVLQIGGPPAE